MSVMRVNELRNKNGDIYAFEIANFLITIRTIVKILKSEPNVSCIEKRRWFSSEDEILCKFKFYEDNFLVLEPYGDSNVYWIGPQSRNEPNVNIDCLINTFKNYRSFIFLWIQ